MNYCNTKSVNYHMVIRLLQYCTAGINVSSFVIFLLLMAFSSLIFCGEKNSGSLESQVKAAYIYNFSKFVYWNDRNGNKVKDTIAIMMAGNDGVTDILREFSGDQKKHPAICLLSLDKFHLGNILYISRSEQSQLPSLLKKAMNLNILTVSDIPGFVRKGGMIGFTTENGKVSIVINLVRVEKAGLKLNAKLLEIAKEVIHD